MIAKKHISIFVVALMAVAVIVCFLAMGYADTLSEKLGGLGVKMEYETRLFDTDTPISVNIKMDEDEWKKMLSNAQSEEYYVCDVKINDTTINNVAVRPKGNTSLSSIAMDPNTDRFSFKLEFDHFVKGQTCYGLDKLILNNNYADATNMKETIVYDMYQYLGADASLYNYAKVFVNGEYWGIYLALEGVESSFMLRNYGTQDGELYKPDSMDIGGAMFAPNTNDPSSADKGNKKGPGQFGFGQGNGGGFSMSGNGVNLNYKDDNLDSYSTIWECEVTKTGKKDHKRVVEALKNIHAGMDLEKYLDVDNTLKYMAVHTFSVNLDSLSGSMAHNYYLYEYEGKLNILPWDYNLSFGGMSMGFVSTVNASSTINFAVDTPFQGTRFFDSLLKNEEYLSRYHEYLRQLVEEYVQGGRFDEVYRRIRNQIDELVKTDPTAFYSFDEYTAAAEMLYKVVGLRAESILGQVNGTIPSTTTGQRIDDSALIDSSGVDIKIMGQMSMGGGGFGGQNRGNSETDTRSSEETEKAQDDSGQNKMPGGFPGDFDMSNMPEGFPGDFDMSNLPEGVPGDFDMSKMQDGDGKGMPGDFDTGKMPDRRDFTPGKAPSSSPISNMWSSLSTTAQNAIILGVCMLLMIGGIVFVKCFGRRK